MQTRRQETLALLRFSLCKGINNRSIRALIDRFGSAEAALRAARDELARVESLGPARADAVRNAPGDAELERELDLMERFRTRLVPFFSEDYPRALAALEQDAPVLLRVRGDYARRDELAVAVVGSRRCSVYGRRMAGRIASELASMGFTVVSGMASGIDSAAHRGALAAKGRTVAVLGCGLAWDMPEREAELAAEIAASGALISELPMLTPPRAGNFPPRNRLISGLSLGVVVVEAAARSGSLITARLAAEQGRAVFAVPGPADSPTSHGCHMLIRDGAVLVENARDVADGLGPLSEPIPLGEPAPAGPEPPTLEDARVLALSERERQVFDLIEATPRHIDELTAALQLPPSIVASTLLTLEVRGLVRQLSGQRYVRD